MQPQGALMRKSILVLSVGAAFAFGALTEARAAAFALVEHGVSGLGNAYAGAAAVAEDASTVWWNPAGMARLPRGRHLLLAGSLVAPSTKFSDRGSAPPLPGILPLGGTGGDAGSTAFVPSAFFATDLAPRWSVGVGVSVPFGLSTEYDDNWLGRFQAIRSEIKTLNVNPSVSYALTDALSVGFGLNYQRAEIETLTAVNLGAVEGRNTLEVDGDAWGFNLGVLYAITPGTRVGVHYRSAVDYELTGTTTFTAVVPSGPVKMDVKTPATLSFSGAHRLDDRWELLADLTWWEWSNIQTVPVVRTNVPGIAGAFAFNFDDSWRASIGANYSFSRAWTLKFGAAFDQTPVRNTESRTVRLPDSDRYWLSAGAKCRISPSGMLDFGYTYVHARNADVNRNEQGATPPAGLVVGTFRARTHVLGVQYQHSF
jgi:long-chain fatty acid transport protein